MKKIFLLMALFYSISFCQGWNATVITTINEGTFSQMDLFTNKDGNHLVIKKSNGTIMYYNLNSAGTVDANKTATLETGADFPNIVGSNNKIYALYQVGSLIKGKSSSNGGASWADMPNNISIGSNTCNGVDAVYETNQGVHIVWATMDNGSNFETYYHRLYESNLSWVDYEVVSTIGGLPTVTFSSNRVHVGYNTCDNTRAAKSRDRYNGSWQSPQEILSSNSYIEKLHAGSTKLFDFYYRYDGVFKLCAKTRDLSGTTWSSEHVVYTGGDNTEILSVANTADGKIHLVYCGGGQNTVHTTYDGSNWGDENIISTWGYPRISSTTNDLFVMWHREMQDLRYLQYDAIPSVPQNNQISFPLNQSPVLTWNANPEPDIAGYRVFKEYKDSDGNVLFSGSELKSATTYSYTDNTFTANYKTGTDVAAYWVKAEDLNSYESGETSHLTGNGVSYYQQKIVRHDKTEKTVIEEYGLSQNYPNPFNPSTEINYQIPSKGFVTLKVYDVLGNEVATLVNEWKEPGSYNAQFTTSEKQLASGMYFYTLNAGKFTDTKKFILLK